MPTWVGDTQPSFRTPSLTSVLRMQPLQGRRLTKDPTRAQKGKALPRGLSSPPFLPQQHGCSPSGTNLAPLEGPIVASGRN